jgi:1,4-dihydroxy-2-naphthoate polyprenyltransferase
MEHPKPPDDPNVTDASDSHGDALDAQRPPSRAGIWWQAVRPFAYTASVTPMLLGAVLAWHMPSTDSQTLWPLLPAILLAGVLFHTGANLISDYYDFVGGIDREDTMGGSGVLVSGLLEPRQIFRGGLVAFALGTVLGLGMLAFRGWPLLALGVIGFAGGYFYCGRPVGLKYRGFGELVIFLLFGPLMVIGSYYVLVGTFHWDIVLISLPVGFLVAAIVQANNLRDMADDEASGIKNAYIAFGPTFARTEYYSLLGAAYLGVLAMIIGGVLPVYASAVIISILPALKIIGVIRRDAAGEGPGLASIDEMTAQVHLLFGVLLMGGIAASRIL